MTRLDKETERCGSEMLRCLVCKRAATVLYTQRAQLERTGRLALGYTEAHRILHHGPATQRHMVPPSSPS
jgi:hypothetical protein